MKCPKCGYLGFEPVERCRNCGYEFSLTPELDLPELPIHTGHPEPSPLEDLALIDAATSAEPAPRARPATTDLDRMIGASPPPARTGELPLFSESFADDVPLITKPSPPRMPLAVRRATPEVPRLRAVRARAPMLDLAMGDLVGAASSPTDAARARSEQWSERADEPQTAGLGARLVAVAIDLLVLALIDVAVIYFTMQICGLPLQDLAILPKTPLAAFLVVQNGGYLVAFTAGGQTLGKMATAIRVVSVGPNATVDFGHAVVRTLVWAVLAIPIGLGFVTALFSRDRRGLHDRCAGTRVVRASI